MESAANRRNQSQADIELSVALRDSLQQDDRLSSDSLDVTVVDGVAAISGTVQSYRRKTAAIDIAESTRGCRKVEDRITVVPSVVESDEEIASHVRASLASHSDVTKEVITVSVRRGIVTLQGNVASRWERQLAGDVALGARGVREVQNLLLVDLGSKIEDEALMRNIQFAISRTGGMESADIRVAVNSSTAVLSGETPELWQRKKAEEIAARFRVSDVINEITVNHAS